MVTSMHKPSSKLAPELVPEPLWDLSAFRLLTRSAWKRVRARVLAEAGSCCSVCGASQAQGMVCHEVWNYDDTASVAALTGFAMLCTDCNLVHHMGRASQLGLADRALAHMAKVNGMTSEEVDALVDQAYDEWKRRSGRHWTMTVDQALRPQYPELKALEDASASPGAGRQRAQARGR